MNSHVPALRVLVAVLLVLAFVLPSGLVFFFLAKWLPCALLAVVLVLAAAAVSVHADNLEASHPRRITRR